MNTTNRILLNIAHSEIMQLVRRKEQKGKRKIKANHVNEINAWLQQTGYCWILPNYAEHFDNDQYNTEYIILPRLQSCYYSVLIKTFHSFCLKSLKYLGYTEAYDEVNVLIFGLHDLTVNIGASCKVVIFQYLRRVFTSYRHCQTKLAVKRSGAPFTNMV